MEAERASSEDCVRVRTAGWRSVLCQCVTAAALMCQTLAQGMAQGWSSPGVEKLREGSGPFVPTEDQVTWIVSIFELGLLVGSVVSMPHATRSAQPAVGLPT